MNKLDLKTRAFLFITNANIVKCPVSTEIKIERVKVNDCYLFNSYEEYVNFFKQYIDNINYKLIDLAIYTRGKKGQVIALKGLCEHIIMKQRINDFYDSYDKSKIAEIHSRGKITPLEQVHEYESMDLCAPGNAIGSAANRCHFFDNCHDCLLEYFSHNEEYDKIEFKLVNIPSELKEKPKQLSL